MKITVKVQTAYPILIYGRIYWYLEQNENQAFPV